MILYHECIDEDSNKSPTYDVAMILLAIFDSAQWVT